MTDASFPPVHVSRGWQHVQHSLLRIVELIPDDKLNWTPKADLWNSRGILLQMVRARDQMLTHLVQDGEPDPNIWTTARTKEDLKRELDRTYFRLERFLSNESQLDATYVDERFPDRPQSGHWIAFGLLEHDIHHRAELLQRLALLDISHDIDL